MTRVRCLNRRCTLNERGTCSASEIDLDHDGQCETAEEIPEDDEELVSSLDDEDLDDWDEEEEEDEEDWNDEPF